MQCYHCDHNILANALSTKYDLKKKYCHCQGRGHYLDKATSNTHKYTHPSTPPLTLKHDMKSRAHREQIDGSKVW